MTKLLGIAVLFLGSGELHEDPNDPHHWSAELLVEGDGATVEYVADFEGSLDVWSSSEEFDPTLEVRSPLETLVDHDSGGGTTPWLRLPVARGDRIEIRVSCPEGGTGRTELHVFEAPETEATRRWSRAAPLRLADIQALWAEESFGDARVQLMELIQEGQFLEGATTSVLVDEQMWLLGSTAWRFRDFEACLLAWGFLDDHRSRIAPDTHRVLIARKNNLSAVLASLGDLEGARPLTEQVLSIRERLLPPGHPELQTARKNLSIILGGLGDHQGALALAEEVLAVREEQCEPEDPPLLDAQNDVAVIRKALGDLGGALQLLQHVHDTRERVLPRDDWDLLNSKQALAATYIELANFEAALSLLDQVQTTRDRLLGPDHPEALAARYSVAMVAVETGDLPRARELLEGLLETHRRNLPAEHPDRLAVAESLAALHLKTGDAKRALELLEVVHEGRSSFRGGAHTELVDTRYSIAFARLDSGDVAGALER